MADRARFSPDGVLPLLAGLAWLYLGASTGFGSFLLSLAPGVLLVGAGAGRVLWPTETHVREVAALGGIAGLILGLVAWIPMTFAAALFLMALSATAVVAAGGASVQEEPPVAEVPAPVASLGLAAKVGADDAILGMIALSAPRVAAGEAARIAREVEMARELFEARGWLEKPADYHRVPLPLETPVIKSARVRVSGGIEFDHLSYESEYEPHPDEPGRDRWQGYAPNRTAHTWVLRHTDRERPWLVCIHGYQMGSPVQDLGAFDPRLFRDILGVNMAVPVLPLHGRRKIGRRSGDGFLSGDVLDTVHAEAQAMWDLRRLLSWIRLQGAPAVGVYGLSLGGYATALLASLEDGLACAIPGIPATDFAKLFWRHARDSQTRASEAAGLTLERASEVFRVISPLALSPKVPHQHRTIFGGVCDRLVAPEQVRDLWEHWDRPRIVWYQGAHVTFMLDPRVRQAVEQTLRDSGVATAKSASSAA